MSYDHDYNINNQAFGRKTNLPPPDKNFKENKFIIFLFLAACLGIYLGLKY